MADRLVDEIRDIEENREAFSSAVDLCENQLSESLRVLNESVRNVLVQNGKAVKKEHESVVMKNREVNSKVEGFQSRVDSMNKQLDAFIDLSSSLDYIDKWARNIKSKMYDVSHIMEDVCRIEQD
ncbi:hypothetical protein WA538_001487, partial [Blastocystis sp. DL]